MSGLNLPPVQLKIKQQKNKAYVFDRLRKQFVRLTPEEFVRQHFIHYLIEHKHYPEGLLANEVCIELGNRSRRCDTVLYDNFLNARMIIEYKAPTVAIDQPVFDQIARYNMHLQVAWLVVSNGLQHFCCYIDHEKQEYFFQKEIPPYDRLKN
ncbi:MAG: type I restriction enzyme HsdR N-terminal domain-containing protein [Dysgonamonadaceae bacterium]|nr:type I restriction enzyme HsdR N-terminal domain-containing protein [Dysgonamonadaceae bacterium]